ncbi:LPXTG cell wall anchor domain-containing protein [Ligilactobacillus araffinosus]|uniref:Gram-positive cocci surface proteins LPxTG domain-containing protein n=1 Tax=Ligilactobacillus araffinosus DSM 20653 TaxID=1423820 RepID=A0A0R1ZPN9_9LACO|nr:LPXTG cell wall anchor domain-containing protein [Ligilactobacillus araffinosus]KRM53494.1 hypothetical protein FC64_GL000406 [Ligilactobacillus araffinosus DSM 20653]
MSDHKNLKKVIAVSSMAAATIGAGTMVNADNVHQQAVSSQKSSITAKPLSETQNAKSSNTVVLKSSQSSKTTSSTTKSSVASSSSSKANSSSVSTKQAQPVSFAAVQQGKMVNDVKATTNPLMDDYNKGINSSDSDLSYDANGAKIDYDSIMQIAKQYDEGDYANKSDLDYIIGDVANSLKEAKEGYDMSKTLSGIPNLQEKQQIYKDSYEAWNNLYNLLTKGEQVTPQPSSTSSSSKKDTSSSQTKPNTTSNVSSASQAKASSKKNSSSSKENETNATSAVNTLKNDANKYQNSNDAVTKSYAQEAQQWLSNVQSFMNGKDISGQSGLNDAINFFKNDMKSLQDTLNASWFNGSSEAKQIIQDQINADKAVLAYLTGQDTQQTSSTSLKKNDVKTSVKKESNNSGNGVKKDVVKVSTDIKRQATVSANKTTTKQTTSDSATKKASMPQTGETNDAGILATIGALTIAAAGAFLFRKRG